MRIWRIELEPGEEAAFHTHLLDYTTVVVEGDVLERPNADGTVDRIQVKPGDFMRWHQGTLRARAEEHRLEGVPQCHHRVEGRAD